MAEDEMEIEKDVYQSIKFPLESILRNPDHQNILNDAALRYSQIFSETVQFTRLWYIKKVDDGVPNFDGSFEDHVQLPILNQSLLEVIIRLITSKSDNRGRAALENHILFQELKNFDEIYYSGIQVETIRRDYLNFNYLPEEIITSAKNNVINRYHMHVERLIDVKWKKFVMIGLIKRKYRFNTQLRRSKLRRFKRQLKLIKNDLIKNEKKSNLIYHPWIDLIRRKYVPKTENVNLNYDIKTENWMKYLHSMILLMKEVQRLGGVVHQVFPQRNTVIPRHSS